MNNSNDEQLIFVLKAIKQQKEVISQLEGKLQDLQSNSDQFFLIMNGIVIGCM